MSQTLMKMNMPEMAQNSFGKQCLSWSWDDGYQRNLKILNRDLRNVIVIDKNTELCKNYANNVIQLSEFKGDLNDNEIETLIHILDSNK